MVDISKLATPAAAAPFEPREFGPLGKRLFDIVVSALLIVAFAPLMLMISAIVFSQVGPKVIFAHTREGKDGLKFPCLKFRTMYLDADKRLEQILATDPSARAEWEATRKLKKDTRILPFVGKFLRKSSLDELPQLFNVLIGQMSLVGPRPVVEEEIRDYYGDVAGLYYSVRPGMTGPWQIGARSDDDYPSRVAKDAQYVRNWSFLQDLTILVKTAQHVANVRQNGAY